MTPEALKEREVAAMELAAFADMEVLSLSRAAVYCDVSVKTLREACKNLDIAFARRGKFYYFPKTSLDAWMRGEELDR